MRIGSLSTIYEMLPATAAVAILGKYKKKNSYVLMFYVTVIVTGKKYNQSVD